jgi:hypothetical protein
MNSPESMLSVQKILTRSATGDVVEHDWEEFCAASESLLTSSKGIPKMFLRLYELSFASIGRNDDLQRTLRQFLYWTALTGDYADFSDGYIFDDLATSKLKSALAESTDGFDSWCFFAAASTAMTAQEIRDFFDRVDVRGLTPPKVFLKDINVIVNNPRQVDVGNALLEGCYIRCALNVETHPFIAEHVIRHVRQLGPFIRCLETTVLAAPGNLELLEAVQDMFRKEKQGQRVPLLDKAKMIDGEFWHAVTAIVVTRVFPGGVEKDVVDKAAANPAFQFWPKLTAHLHRCLYDPSVQIFPLPTASCSACNKRALGTMICSKCKAARYCSKMCQRKHWKLHKKVCV